MYVIMLHSLGVEQSNWYRRWLSIPIVQFEKLCQYLVKKKYTTHFLDEWYEYFSVERKKDPKKLVLTFDDGYLDNWVYALPILKKYGLKATVFINPEFVDPGTKIRPTLGDVWAGNCENNELQTLGFLNWQEIREMQNSGVFDIQSHSMSHNFYFHSDKIIDIYNGQLKYDWIAWFTHPGQKAFCLTQDQTDLIPKGFPVFEYGRALGLRRYLPDNDFIKKSIEIYNNGIISKSNLIQKLEILKKKYPGTYETDKDLEERYRYEIFESKRILEDKLNKKVDFLCWPGGGYTKMAIELSKEAGYKASTYGSSEKNRLPGYYDKYKRIPRFGIGSVISLKNDEYYYIKNKKQLIYLMKSRTGNFPLRVLLKIRKEIIRKVY